MIKRLRGAYSWVREAIYRLPEAWFFLGELMDRETRIGITYRSKRSRLYRVIEPEDSHGERRVREVWERDGPV